jgi:hypothetical protein
MAKKSKKELKGFEEGGKFHPIRSSSGYSPKKAGDSKKSGKKR